MTLAFALIVLWMAAIILLLSSALYRPIGKIVCILFNKAEEEINKEDKDDYE